jgi:chemotaxis protein MotA
MDLATVIGLVVAFSLMLGAIMLGSPLDAYIDYPSIMVTCGGTLASLFVCYPAGRVKSALNVVKNAFFTTPRKPGEVLELMKHMSNRARREGVLALEDIAEGLEDPFVIKGIQMVVDGHDPAAIEEVLYNEIDKMEERHKDGKDFFDTMALMAPAFGMIGTLIGLVAMLQNLDDPTAIGPAMAVALLTTFYGAVIANAFATPIAIKLGVRSKEELAEKLLVVQGLLSILAGESPRFLVDRLNAQLSPDLRLKEAV